MPGWLVIGTHSDTFSVKLKMYRYGVGQKHTHTIAKSVIYSKTNELVFEYITDLAMKGFLYL